MKKQAYKKKTKAGATKESNHNTRTQKRQFLKSLIQDTLYQPESDTNPNNHLFANRRAKAIMNYSDRLEDDVKIIDSARDFELFSLNELVSVPDYNTLDCDVDIRIAAALWMLDHIRTAGNLEAAYDLLSNISSNVENQIVPIDFFHPCYEKKLICSVVCAISHRYKNSLFDPVIITEDNATGKEPSELWKKLTSLLSEKDIRHAQDAFRNKIWEITSHRQLGLGRLLSALKQTGDMSRNSEDNILTQIIETESSDVQVASFGFTDRYEEILDRITDYAAHFEDFLVMDQEIIRQRFGNEVVDVIPDFMVDDPYEICFGLISLLDSGDDAPWLFRSGYVVVLSALRMLPWYMCQEHVFKTWRSNLINNQTESMIPDQLDYYHATHLGKNYAQLIYEMCECIIPTGIHPFEKNRVKLIAEGMDEKTAGILSETADLLLITSALEEDRHKSEDFWREYEEAQRFTPEDDMTELYIESTTLKAELDEAKKQIKKLKSELAIAIRNLQNEKVKNEAERMGFQFEHRELSDLRELVFHQGLSDDEQKRLEKPVKQYKFPYKTRKRAVVFGGHDSFLKVIKPMLPAVKFVNAKNLSYSPEIIRNADVVWIQHNCISHSQFFSIAKHCKAAGVQIRYFTYASAEKCAEQLVQEDLEQVG